MEVKHNFVNQSPGFRCSVCQLGWWGDCREDSLPECGSEEALKLAEWQLTVGKKRDEDNRRKVDEGR